MQNSLAEGTIVFRTPTFAADAGQNTTRPSGTSVHPKNLDAAGDTNAQFEYVSVPGSNIPTFDASAGVNIIFPDGKSVPPWK